MGGYLKSIFVQNSQFLIPSFLSPCSTLFVLHVPLFSTYVHFSELSPPLSKKLPTFMNFRMKKWGVKREIRIFFFVNSI